MRHDHLERLRFKHVLRKYGVVVLSATEVSLGILVGGLGTFELGKLAGALSGLWGLCVTLYKDRIDPIARILPAIPGILMHSFVIVQADIIRTRGMIV